MKQIAAIFLILFGFSGHFAVAQDSRTDVSAVGLIVMTKGGGCTGTLIAADLVLTAAHCLMGEIDGRPVKATELRFLPSLKGGKPGVTFAGKSKTIHPVYLLPGLTQKRKIQRDIGVLQLAKMVPPEVAIPIQTGRVSVLDEAGFLVSYRGRKGGPVRQRKCEFIDIKHNLIEFACDVRGGESGSPLLVRRDGILMLVGVVSSRTKLVAQPIGLAVEINAGLEGLFEAADLPRISPPKALKE